MLPIHNAAEADRIVTACIQPRCFSRRLVASRVKMDGRLFRQGKRIWEMRATGLSTSPSLKGTR